MNQNDLPLDALKRVVAALPVEVKEVLISFPQLFVAGGAIRAILADEKVKDIDVFTTNLDVLPIAVPKYIEQFLCWGDWEERQTPCTRTINIADCDTPSVQFINNATYESPEQCVKQFDFTVCQAAVWHDGECWRSYCADAVAADR